MSTINVKSSKSAASAVNYVLYGADAKVRSRLRSEGRTRAAALAIHTADGASTPEQFLARAESLARLHGRKVEAYTLCPCLPPGRVRRDLTGGYATCVRCREEAHRVYAQC